MIYLINHFQVSFLFSYFHAYAERFFDPFIAILVNFGFPRSRPVNFTNYRQLVHTEYW